MEPSEQIEMRSMIEDAYPDEDFSLPIFAVPTVVPGRTFLEKVFLLHEEFNRPNGCTHIERITRHIFSIQYHFFLRKVLRRLCGTTISRCKSASFMLMRLLLMRLWRGYMSCRTDSGHWDGKTIIDGMAEYGGNPEAEKQPGKIYTNQKIDNCNFFWGWNIRFIYALNNEYYTFCWQRLS